VTVISSRTEAICFSNSISQQ